MPGSALSMAMRGFRVLAAISVSVVVSLLAACSQSANTSDASAQPTGSFDEKVIAEIADASASGASEAQLALLDRARGEGQVTVEIARQARRAYSACAAAAGVQVTFKETTRPDGWVRTVTRVDGSGNADAEQISLACERKEALWVTGLYDTQPTAVQAISDYLDQQAPALRSCLEAAGFKPKPDATGMELAMLSTRTDDPRMRTAGTRCLQRIGVDGF